jgi:hypothetical protein
MIPRACLSFGAVSRNESSMQLVIQFASALAGATVIVVDPLAEVSALVSIVAAENAKALFFSPRFNGDARVSKIQEAFREELEPFTCGARVGYEPIASKRLLSLRWIVQTGFDPIEGIVRLKDLPVYGEGKRWLRSIVSARVMS